MGAFKMVAAVGIIAITTLFILPASLRMIFGPNLPSNLPIIIAMALLFPMAIFAGLEMWRDVQERRQARVLREKMEAIEQQTFGCIKPQVLDSFVVFPVRVNKREGVTSSWVELGEQAVAVNLAATVKVTGGLDTEGPLRRLCEATFRQGVEVIIYCGEGRAGPTGLSVGVGRPDFGPYLASNVGHSIHEAIRMGLRVP